MPTTYVAQVPGPESPASSRSIPYGAWLQEAANLIVSLEWALDSANEQLRGNQLMASGVGAQIARLQEIINFRDTVIESQRLEIEKLKARGTPSAPVELLRGDNLVSSLRLENARLRAEYQSVCKTISDMHAAAMGEVCGPKLGVVEDVANIRQALIDAEHFRCLNYERALKAEKEVAELQKALCSSGPDLRPTLEDRDREIAQLRSNLRALKEALHRPPAKPITAKEAAELAAQVFGKIIMREEITTKQAVDHLCQALQNDPDFAHSWQSNIAMPIYDAGRGWITHEKANEVADTLMRNLFGVKKGGAA